MSTEGLFHSFSVKVYSLLGILVLALASIAAPFFYFSQTSALEDALKSEATALAESLADSARVGIVLEDTDFIEQSAGGILSLNNLLFVDFYDSQWVQLSQLGAINFKEEPSEEAKQLSLISPAVNKIVNHPSLKSDAITALVPVRTEQDVAGYVRVSLSMKHIQDESQALLFYTIVGTVLMLIFTLLAAIMPVRYVTRPINKLLYGVQRIREGDFNFRIEMDARDELGELAINYNHMADELIRREYEIDSKRKELLKSETQYRKLFENIQHSLYICDANGKLLDCNQAMVQLFGYNSRDEMKQTIQSSDDMHTKPEQRERILAGMEKNGRIRNEEATFYRKDGSEIHVLLTATYHFDERGEKTGYEGMMQDITELKQLEEQLMQAQKMEAVGTLAGGVAHDFNNLLTAIMSYNHMAMSHADNPDEVRKYLSRVEKATDRAAKLTKNLLGFARKGKMRSEHININALVDEVQGLLHETIDRRIELTSDLADHVWSIKGDPGQLHQVLVNLCVNARDAILEHGGSSIQIETSHCLVDERTAAGIQDGYAGVFTRLSVKDDGPGIPEEIRSKIFDPFFTTKEVGKGTGLGLSMVYGIVKNHQGFLHLITDKGKGSRFDIYFPAENEEFIQPQKNAEEFHDKKSAAKAMNEKITSGHTILVVDDEEDLHEIAQTFLEESGYQTLSAIDGQEALNQVDENGARLDLVLLDMMLPIVNGEEVLKQIRQTYPNLPVIIMSGYAESTLNPAIKDQQYNGFIEKPYTLPQLRLEVERVLSRQSSYRH